MRQRTVARNAATGYAVYEEDHSPIETMRMVLEQDIMQRWRELFYGRDVSSEAVGKGEQLLEALRPESPLRYRLRAELDELREMCAKKSRIEIKEVAVDGAAAKKSRKKPKRAAPQRLPKKLEILAKVAQGELQVEEASRLLEQIEGPKGRSLSCKVSVKGAVSVYGLQRMPVTLYLEQWNRLLDFFDDIRQFIGEHNAELKRKANR